MRRDHMAIDQYGHTHRKAKWVEMIKQTRKARIEVREVGQKFGSVAVVIAANNRAVFESRIVPYGFIAACYDEAKAWADAHGYKQEPDHA